MSLGLPIDVAPTPLQLSSLLGFNEILIGTSSRSRVAGPVKEVAADCSESSATSSSPGRNRGLWSAFRPTVYGTSVPPVDRPIVHDRP